MKKIFLFLLILFPQLVFWNNYIEQRLSWHLMRVVEYPIGTWEYEIKVVKTDDATNLGNLLKQNNAISWINGVFFCPTDYSWCGSDRSYTDNERYVEGEKFWSYINTWYRAVFGWDKDETPFIYRSGTINAEDEEKIYYWLGNLPLLLYNGQNMLEEYWENDQILANMKIPGVRNFVCSDKDKTNIYFGLVYDATIDQLTNILQEFGCYDALNLDAGLSTVFMYNSRYIVGPQKRDILDGIGIVKKWFDVEENTQLAENISGVLLKELEKRSKRDTMKYKTNISAVMEALNILKNNIYHKNSSDIYKKNFVWEFDRIWYKIEISSPKTFARINLINEIYENLKRERNLLETP